MSIGPYVELIIYFQLNMPIIACVMKEGETKQQVIGEVPYIQVRGVARCYLKRRY